MSTLVNPSPLAPPHSAAAAPVHDYALPLPSAAQRALARAWLWLGLLALVGAGVFSILLVAARTPGVNQWLPAVDFFRVALVVHVDLSVLVWFAAMAAMLWTLIATPRAEGPVIRLTVLSMPRSSRAAVSPRQMGRGTGGILASCAVPAADSWLPATMRKSNEKNHSRASRGFMNFPP